MPRLGRLHVPGGCYHVMGRGLERRRIFSTEEDKIDFLARLSKGIAKYGSECLAWSLMSNHYHLLIRVGDQPLSKLMSSVLGGYAGSYNRRKKRSGYVFQNRYKSILCDQDTYLTELIRYMHLNPLKAKIVTTLKKLDAYPWTGHSDLVGSCSPSLLSDSYVLSLFGPTKKKARHEYRKFIVAGLDRKEAIDFDGGGLVRS